jgi:hypothetical protein
MVLQRSMVGFGGVVIEHVPELLVRRVSRTFATS